MTSTARITTPRQGPIPNPTGAAAVPWERRELMAWWRTPSAQTPTWSLEDDHAAFIATVTAQIAQGVAPWQQSWTPGARRLPEHLVSGHAYWSVPALHLSVAHTAKGYRDNRWATATEIQALGGQVPASASRTTRRSVRRWCGSTTCFTSNKWTA